MVRVVIVDNDPLIRAGVAHVLGGAGGIDVAATAAVPDAVETIQEHAPRVVLLDSCVADADALSQGIGALPDPPAVCVLSAYSDERFIATALGAGATGYVLKDIPPDRFADVVRCMAQGWTMVSAPVSRKVVARFLTGVSRSEGVSRVARLTAREREVLVLLACGLSNIDIGARLHLSLGTVKDHIKAIFRKLGVERRLQAALLAERAGLLP
ncbi:response regulator transcription factor [Streptomyces syringium]|uniref:response regulator transcription factor n=1 Tax=Streptomyces syringium TaxID=76729 RepID=UPI0033C7267C